MTAQDKDDAEGAVATIAQRMKEEKVQEAMRFIATVCQTVSGCPRRERSVHLGDLSNLNSDVFMGRITPERARVRATEIEIAARKVLLV